MFVTVTATGTVSTMVAVVQPGTTQWPALPDENSHPFTSLKNAYEPAGTATSECPFASL